MQCTFINKWVVKSRPHIQEDMNALPRLQLLSLVSAAVLHNLAISMVLSIMILKLLVCGLLYPFTVLYLCWAVARVTLSKTEDSHLTVAIAF